MALSSLPGWVRLYGDREKRVTHTGLMDAEHALGYIFNETNWEICYDRSRRLT